MRCGAGRQPINPCCSAANFIFMEKQKIMVDLKIEQNERIIRRTKEAWSFDGDEERELESLILTNKHLICVYEKSVALFFKGETIVDKKPLSSISIIDGVLQVKNILDDNFGESLQILYDNGVEELYFLGDAPKSEYQKWESVIKKAIIENNRTFNKNDEIPVSPISSEGNKQDILVSIVEEKVNEKRDMSVFCISCGAKNNIGARFCQSCGTPLEAENKPRQSEKPLEENQNHQSTYYERRQEYAGKIIKCPNCGEVLGSFLAVCPSCGYELRGVHANSSLKELSAKLEAVDLQPDIAQKGTLLKNLSRELTEKEKQKITLIRNFPIPNTKEDLYEFLIMAASNVDTEHIEGWNSAQSEGEKALSEAWKAKYEQAYHKAKISFGNSQEFQELNKSYMTKIQKHERRKSMFNKGLIIFIVIYVIACIIGVCFMFKDNSTRQKAVDEENQRLELILDDIQKYIEEGEYAKARSLNATLVFNASVNLQSAIDSKEHWDDVRKELYDVIENAESKILKLPKKNNGTEVSRKRGNCKLGGKL